MIIIVQTAEAYQFPLGYSESGAICVAGVLGLEPRLTEPESVGLPITLYPIAWWPGGWNPPWRKDKLYCKSSFGPKPLPDEDSSRRSGSGELDVGSQLHQSR
jgi:hypothetical protein